MGLNGKCDELLGFYKFTNDTLTLYYRSSMEVQFPNMNPKDRDLVKSWLSMMISRPVDESFGLPLSFKTCAFASMMRLFYFDKKFARESIDEFISLFCQSLLKIDLVGDCKCLMTMAKFFKQVCPSGTALQQLYSECSNFSPKSKVLEDVISFIGQLQSNTQVHLDSIDRCINHLITNADDIDKRLREATLLFSAQSDLMFYCLFGEMSGIALGRRLSFLASKRLLKKISQCALPDDMLKNSFLRFTLFTLFSYLSRDSSASLLEDVISGCDLASMVRTFAVLPFSSIPAELVDRLINSYLGRIMEIVEFLIEEEPPKTNSTVMIGLISALTNIISECPDHPLVRASISRICIAACKGNNGSSGEGMRLAFCCLTKSLLSIVVDPSSVSQLLQSYCQRTNPFISSLLIHEMSRIDLPSRQKEQIIRLLAEMLPKARGQELTCQTALIEHSIACFATTSPMHSLLEIPPFSLYNQSGINRKVKVDISFLSKRLQHNPPLTNHGLGLARKLSNLEKLIKDRGQSMDWLEDELDRLVDKAYSCSIKNKR